MTITLNLAPEDEAQLNVIAAKMGQNADTVAYDLFAAALTEFQAKHSVPADAQTLSKEERILTPEEEAEAISIGLDASFAGRTTPLAEWSARFRARHNIPEGVKPMTHQEAMRLP